MQCGCSSKPNSRDRPETSQKRTTPLPKSAESATSRAAAKPSTLPEAGGGKAISDLDQLAIEAEKEDSKKPRKNVQPLILPTGTTFIVHLESEVGSKISKSGDDFSGTLAAPIAVEDRVVIPAGSKATGRVVRAKRAGRLKGGAILALELRAVVVNGKKLLMHTQMMTTESKGKGKETAGMVGGEVVGAQKDASVGTTEGGSAGATVTALTGDRDITLPAEALVAFRLSDPIEIKRNTAEKVEP